VQRLISPLVEEILPHLSQKKVWLDKYVACADRTGSEDLNPPASLSLASSSYSKGKGSHRFCDHARDGLRIVDRVSGRGIEAGLRAAPNAEPASFKVYVFDPQIQWFPDTQATAI
jgi:hypothetical protein